MIHPPAVAPSGFTTNALQLLQRVQQGTSPIELIYATHPHWPFRPGQTTHTRSILRVSVLDSSFNPPTLAHLALANSLAPLLSHLPVSPSVEPYDAQMLLLSVRNADKVPKPGDATFVQRLEMMHIFSQDVHSINDAESGSAPLRVHSNVAVAIIDEPAFVGKSTLLLRFLKARLATVVGSTRFYDAASLGKRDPSRLFPSPKLTFLLGFDTFVRVFSPRYYPSEEVMVQMLRTFLSLDQEDCRIVCAHRGSINADEAFKVAHEFIASDRITFINIGTKEQTYSSSEVRAKLAVGDSTWKRLVTNGVADYITKQRVYSDSEEGQ